MISILEKIFVFLICFFIVVVTVGSANEIPCLMFNSGINDIELSFINNWDSNINNIKIIIDENKLPSWIEYIDDVKSIDVLKGKKSEENIFLRFNVIDPPNDASAIIPFVISDKNGNQWKSTLKIKTPLATYSKPSVIDALYTNYPNPFNSSTTIIYSLIESKHAELKVYNNLGQNIRTLVNDVQIPGVHSIQWDGCDDHGLSVASGIYFFILRTDSFVKTQRMTLIK